MGIHDKIHKMELPKTIIVGSNILDKLSEVYTPFSNSKKLAIITGPNIYKKIKDRLCSGLSSINFLTFFVKENTWPEINRIINHLLNIKNINYIVGLGGGKSIDIAKMASYKLNIPFISIPTSPSHDGIASQFVSIRDYKQAYSIPTRPPLAVIVDINIISKAPKRLIASGVGDAIAKITAVKDWQLAKARRDEYYGDYAANLALLGAEMVVKHSKEIGFGDVESIRVLVEALISDGVAAGIAGSSRPCSGSEHLFSHALDIYSKEHALHGEQCGIGTIIMSYFHELDYDKIRQALKNAGAPTNTYEIGISPQNLIRALVKAKDVRPERYTILNEIKLDEKYAEEVLKETEII